MPLQGICLPRFVLTGIEVGSICSDKVLWIVHDLGALYLEKLIETIICFYIHGIHNQLSYLAPVEWLPIPLDNAQLYQIPHNVAERGLRFRIQGKNRPDNFCFGFYGFVHSGANSINHSVLELKSIRDSSTHIKSPFATG